MTKVVLVFLIGFAHRFRRSKKNLWNRRNLWIELIITRKGWVGNGHLTLCVMAFVIIGNDDIRRTLFYNMLVKTFSWNADKNNWLKKERTISFEDVLFHLENDDVLDVIDHPNQERYPGQMVYVIVMEGYVYLVPFMETETEVFLKTIIPSRKATRQYRELINE